MPNVSSLSDEARGEKTDCEGKCQTDDSDQRRLLARSGPSAEFGSEKREGREVEKQKGYLPPVSGLHEAGRMDQGVPCRWPSGVSPNESRNQNCNTQFVGELS